ncbi:hypothetical protein HPULCUR_002105 [Helicostylum pulchrum]|uniref:Uncharacterized protein n=1 Tax=Helicostylum pulchrum TaxID=562976 RepID=A0ABP9XR34_9FUNG
MPPISRPKKHFTDTSNKKIDSYFKPMSKTKRKIEHDENCQENVRPSPSPPNSQPQQQQHLLKTKAFGEKTFGARSDRENIGSSSKPFGLSRMDRENNGCKTFGTTNALMWQKFDRQPLREKSIKPVNTLKSSSIISKPVQTTFNVLSDKDIENGLEDSLGSLKRSDDGEVNTQYVEEGGTLDSNYSVKSPISYHSDNDTNDTFEPYADQDQISEYTASDDAANLDEFDTQETIDVYRDDDDDEPETFSVYVDKDESSNQERIAVYRDDDDDEPETFNVYVDKDQEEIDVYRDGDEPETFKVYTDKDQEKTDVYRDNDGPETFKVYVDKDESSSKDECDSDSNDTTTFKVYVDPELRKDKFTEHKDAQEQQLAEASDSKALPSTKELTILPKFVQSLGSIPDFFSDDEDKEDSGSTFGKGIFGDEEEDERDYGSISVQSDDFSINDGCADSLASTPEFKIPTTPNFSSRYKQLLKEREQAS